MESQKHHYRLCFHIRALLILLPRLLPRFTRDFWHDVLRQNLKFHFNCNPTINARAAKSNWAGERSTQLPSCPNVKFLRLNEDFSSTSPLFFISVPDLNASIHLANIKNLGCAPSRINASSQAKQFNHFTGGLWVIYEPLPILISLAGNLSL